MKFLERYFGFVQDTDCVVLTCGARIYRLDGMLAQLLSLCRDEDDFEMFREDDSVLFCGNNCSCLRRT